MLLRAAAGKMNHFSTKQLWVQGAMQTHGMGVQRVRHAENASDILTNPVRDFDVREGLKGMGYDTPEVCMGHP